MTYRLIDHTADFGIQVFGADLPALFGNAAQAVFSLITDIHRLRPTSTAALRLTGADWPDLMVNWLRELLYLWNGEQRLVAATHIRSLSEFELLADLDLDVFDPLRHVIHMEIKAVTYHQIQVHADPGGWQAQIIFDI